MFVFITERTGLPVPNRTSRARPALNTILPTEALRQTSHRYIRCPFINMASEAPPQAETHLPDAPQTDAGADATQKPQVKRSWR